MTVPERAAPYRGLYINLDRSVERRERLEAQLSTTGLAGQYARLTAVDGTIVQAPTSLVKPAELGCFLSHMRALDLARSWGVPVHVLEDDTILSPHLRLVIEDAIVSKLFDHFDIVYTDTFVHCEPFMLKWMKSVFDGVSARRPLRLADLQVIDLSKQSFAGATSYIVGPRAAERIFALLRQEIATGPKIAFDLFLRDQVLAGRLRAACVFPFLTSIRLETVNRSTLRGQDPRIDDPSVAVMAALRYSFFIDRDLENVAKPYLDAATKLAAAKSDLHREFLLQAIDFVMSDDFKAF